MTAFVVMARDIAGCDVPVGARATLDEALDLARKLTGIDTVSDERFGTTLSNMRRRYGYFVVEVSQ